MKVQNIYCKCCKKETQHLQKSNQTNGETVVFGILLLGLAFATREFWYRCSVCDNKIK